MQRQRGEKVKKKEVEKKELTPILNESDSDDIFI